MKARTIVFVDVIFLTFVFLLANIRSSIFWSLYPPTDTFSSAAWREIFLWLLVFVLMFYLLIKRNLLETYLQAWRQQPFLVAFLIFSFASTFWSNTWTVTLHRSLAFIFATAAAVYLGVRYSINKFLKVLVVLGAVILVASCILVFVSPVLGTDLNTPYNGAWRGIFWHKNQLGNILPIFTLVFMVCFFSLKSYHKVNRIIIVLLYILSLIAIFFANSASGYVLVFLLHLTFGTAFLWLKIRHLLRPTHYYIALAVVLAGVVAVFFNLDFVFRLLNRTPTFTGRAPMWTILLRNVFPQKPLFGQGFGTIWSNFDFRIQMRDLVRWEYPVMISDNGFLDILLNLGIVGLILFLLNYVKVWVASVQYFLRELCLEGFFPIIFMIYTFFANLTFSLFMETEVFVWMLIVALMIIIAKNKNEIHDGGNVNLSN